jgi:hypothetical protein
MSESMKAGLVDSARELVNFVVAVFLLIAGIWPALK